MLNSDVMYCQNVKYSFNSFNFKQFIHHYDYYIHMSVVKINHSFSILYL